MSRVSFKQGETQAQDHIFSSNKTSHSNPSLHFIVSILESLLKSKHYNTAFYTLQASCVAQMVGKNLPPMRKPSLKNDRMISVRFQGKPFSITVIQVYASTSNAEEAEFERFYEDLHDFLELTPKKYVLFIIGDWNAKVGSQGTPGVTEKFGLGIRNEAGQRLIEICQENTQVIANTLFQQHRRRLYTWTSPDGQHQNQINYILCSQRWRSSI